MKKRFQEEVYRQAKPAREEPPPLPPKEEGREKDNPQPSALRRAIELKEERRERADPQAGALKNQIEATQRQNEGEVARPSYTVVKARHSIKWQVIGLGLLLLIVIIKTIMDA